MIYFDNNATTRPAKEVVEEMLPFLTEEYGNPSSAYGFSAAAKTAVAEARQATAFLLRAERPDEIVFTSCGTESDNWAVGGALAAMPGGNHIVTTSVEHEAVRNMCDLLETGGVDVTRLAVDAEGLVDLGELRDSLREDTAVVSMMLANNESGVLFPVDEAAGIVKKASGALFHVDAVNAAGKVPIDLASGAIDLLSISAHKFHGPKGIGALYIRHGVEIPSSSIGGGQEMGRRAGTEAVHQIAGLGAAAKFASDLGKMEEVRVLRDRLESEVLERIPGTFVNGHRERRLPNTSNISFEGANGEMLLAALNDAGVCVSTGSACNEGLKRVSPVLKAMGVPFERANGSIRFSLGRFNTEDEVEQVLDLLPALVERARRVSARI